MGQMLDMNTLLRHLLFLLEYCMVTGYDWWDVLLHMQPGMVHNLVEKLHEEYMRQNQALQQVGGPGSCSVGHTVVNCCATGN
jgi:mediator of RNA polymerase II transcription subunit 16